MPAALHGSSNFRAPEVTQAEIDWFHEAHFSHAAAELFHADFLRPQNTSNHGQDHLDHDEWYEEEEDDGLGYYPDGVKRTLTDEQIAIFRHSELEALRRAEAKAPMIKEESPVPPQGANTLENAKNMASAAGMAHTEGVAQADASGKAAELEDGSEDGEIEAEKPQLTKSEARRRKRQRANQRKRQQQQKFQPEKKPDLRKRTWDVVETGMDSLDYDESEMTRDAGANPAAKRRQISYDD